MTLARIRNGWLPPGKPSAGGRSVCGCERRIQPQTGAGDGNGFSEFDVSWFEEPVTSDDLEGLHLIRNQGPPGMNIAAGEYGYDVTYFKRMLEAQGSGCFASGCNPLWRIHRIFSSRRGLRSPPCSSFRSLRPGIASPRGMRRPAVSCTENIFMIMFASSRCFLTGHGSRTVARFLPICPGQATAWNSSDRMRRSSRFDF